MRFIDYQRQYKCALLLRTMHNTARTFTFLLAATLPMAVLPDTPTTATWDRFNQGSVIAIMRHAVAPGVGDPPHFAIDDCNTQRNLSERGREQAQTIGMALKGNGINAADVYSSAWCRCIDTAKLLDAGTVEQLPSINSFFRNAHLANSQTIALMRWMELRLKSNTATPAILVTHQVNITALTGRGVSSGELLFINLHDNGLVRVVDSLLIEP